MPQDSEITRLLRQLRNGKPEASEQLYPLVYQELRRIARHHMSRERPDHTLQATAVVNEAYLRMAGDQNKIDWEDRAHFFGFAARIMRQVLMDYARQRRAEKRGGEAQRVAIDSELLVAEGRLDELLILDDLLDRLSAMDPQQARVVELRIFGGLNVEETAEALGISPRTVGREWQSAKAWLDRELSRTVNEP